ncbi:MAG: 50S ribosomal protein L29 [Vampirovibrio sp.]|nr:50S ribosomal protein L29 [Vampirovibrio sp.]
MKVAEMRELTPDELEKQVADSRKELMEARFKNALHQLENPAQMRLLRLRIAQLKTVMREKQLVSEKQAPTGSEKE